MKGYNPNGQDMAVKAAVVGYQEITKESSVDPQVDGGEEDSGEEDIQDHELDELERKDLEGLLLSDEVSGGDETDGEGGICER